MMHLKRTNSKNKQFGKLVTELDSYLASVDGKEHDFYNQFNKIDAINNVVILTMNNETVACGAIKEYESGMEVKRMFTKPGYRGMGCAQLVLNELEKWTIEMNKTYCILETGKKQKEAIQLYVKSGYAQIPNYGPYQGVENSVCFQKNLL